MNVSLTPELEKFVESKIASGRYQSASEVVREALRNLEEHDRLKQLRLEELRKDVAVGLEQLRRGEAIPGEEVFNEIRRKSQAKRRQNKK